MTESFRRFLIVVLALGSCALAQAAPSPFVRGSAEDDAAALAEVQRAMGLLDAGEHGKAWDQAARAFQDGTPRLVFIGGIKSMRRMTGTVRKRTFQSIGFTKDPKEGFSGRRALVVLDTSFDKAGPIEERVLLLEQNGQWRLAGYLLRKQLSPAAAAAR